ncbi:hypothetical protein C7H19_15420 [Aphanothece hegewaldii CCALA 016]|uniref:DUF3854 domain-containing protein n=1 Tax=Aphanothece hegewaldii CCALA 016 TaxID=2107694 RepID=A0A2T1LVR5_9CHRO|nr:plasmid replication protein, CyRepA1 family [Aphanothece hegewaldii]PSF35813.1 hypothetical protein C7H19_15420 [Aphanothece hegewaldii CCALA 016]
MNEKYTVESHHYQEFKRSAIASEIIELNFKSIENNLAYKEENSAYESLLYGLPNTERRNDGRLRDKWIKRYSHLDDGGWWCGTIDPLTGSESEWGCFKPDKPKIDFDSKKPIKYEHPPKVPTEVFFLRVTWEIGLKIATNCGLEANYKERMATLIGIATTLTFLKTEDTGFWQWVIKNPKIRLMITEGAKKTASLLSAGYCTIGLPGIWGGYRQPKDAEGIVTGLPYLIQKLVPFATPEREISFCFDHDQNPKTAQNVRRAIAKTGKLFAIKGCQVSVIAWVVSEKGVDDLIAAKGHEYFDTCYKERLTIEEYQLEEIVDLSPYIDLNINERYLPDGLVPPPNAKIIGLQSIQGTGKTEYLARLIKPLLDEGKRVIVIVHREQLAIALSNRFCIDYRTEIYQSATKGIFGYTLCIDSLHPFANPKFNPQNWSDADLVLDEAEQAFWHLLNGETCKKNRVAILKTLKELIQVVISGDGKIYLADADLSAIAVNYVKALVGFPVPTWIVKNNCIPNQGKRKCYQFTGNDPSQLVSQLVKKIEAGEKPFILTDGQKHRSKYGTRNLEYDLRKRFPHLRILRIDSESVADPKHPAFGCMGNLDEILKNYDIVIASPTIETGVSIDLKNHFTSVWQISHGVQTVDGVCQGIERVRDHVPRYIWLKSFSPNRVGNGSIDVKTLLASTHKLAELNIRLLQKAGFHEFDGVKYAEENEEFNGISPSLLAWAKRACVLNYQNRFFRKHVIKKLTAMGYEVISFNDDDDFDAQLIKQEITLSQQENYTDYCEKVSEIENPTDNEFSELKEKRSKTEGESIKLQKGRLCRRYLTENVKTDLIQKDDDGWYAKIRLHYFLTMGNLQLSERDRKYLQKMSEAGNGELFKPDVNSSLLSVKIATLKLINISQFLDGQQEFTSNSLQEWFEEISKPIPRSQIKSILGMSINPQKDTPIAVAQRLLGLMGLKMTCLGRFGIHQDSTKMVVERSRDMDSPQHNELTMTPIDLETNSTSRDSQSVDSSLQTSTTKNRQRVYRLLTEEPDGRNEIFERWLEKAMSTPCINNEIETGEMAA